MKTSNPVWNFFSSVKLALFTLGCLALTSIVGTVIPQKEAAGFYVKTYGAQMAQLFAILDIPEMYTSWWFLGLLGLLTVNLIVCSIDRFPTTWRIMTRDDLDLAVERIDKMRCKASCRSTLAVGNTVEKLQTSLSSQGWKAQTRAKEDGTQLLFAGKAPWSRTGVYIVHLSILVIFLGAIYGQLTGFKASIMLPERQSSSKVFSSDGGEPIDLGFEVRCDRFDIEFYANTMPKEYRSRLTILKDGSVVLQRDIEVNHPLTYDGITFYQSSYQGYRDFLFSVAKSGDERAPATFSGAYRQEVNWEDQGVSFGIINLESRGERVERMKVWFNDELGPPSQFWLAAGDSVDIQRPDATYRFSAKQRYATGLQVAKDPGVWVVYLGCALMLIGLYISFFISHRRIWVIVRREDQHTAVELRGSANKNKTAFAKSFQELAETTAKEFQLPMR